MTNDRRIRSLQRVSNIPLDTHCNVHPETVLDDNRRCSSCADEVARMIFEQTGIDVR